MKIVKDIEKSIFRAYDIRGTVGKDLNEDVYYTLGRAYGTFLSRRRIDSCVIGRDGRLTSEDYSKAFVLGLLDCGIDVFDIGLTLTQVLYYSVYEFKTRGSAMITSSHNPSNSNGLKLGTGYSETMLSEEIQSLRDIVLEGKYPEGKGNYQTVDIYPTYRKYILSLFDFKKRWKIVVDSCNAVSGLYYPYLLREKGFEVIDINSQLDGNFPLGDPDPTEFKVLNRLGEKVKEVGADIGFAYDGDGDRLAVVDENGKPVYMDSIVALLSKDVLEFMPGEKIVFNTLCSKQVPDTILACKGEPVMWLSGHSFIKSKLKELRSPFGGELSGHLFFMDNFFGHDDAAYASFRLLSFLERKDSSISKEISSLPNYIGSPQIKLSVIDESLKNDLVYKRIYELFKSKWPDEEYTTIDGVRVDGDDFMVIIRPSQNGSYIVSKFESKSLEKYNDIKLFLRESLKKFPEIDWSKSSNTEAFE